MGLILDSSVLISAERQGQNVRQMLSSLANLLHDTEIAISVVTLIELAHGAARADTPQRKNKRKQFIQELLTALPVHSITASIALRAGQIDGNNQAKGLRLPLSDLLIGVTALEAGYGVGTSNSSSLSAYSGSVNHADLIGSADICRTGVSYPSTSLRAGSTRLNSGNTFDIACPSARA